MTEDEDRRDDIQLRQVPQNDIDLQMQLTEPNWGNMPKELKEKLQKIIHIQNNPDGTTVVYKADMWALLEYYNRDVRLGNLSSMMGELQYVRYYLDLAGDCLNEGYQETFLICIVRAATVLESSQSKGGWLRNLFNTAFIKRHNINEEPKRRSLFGSRKEEQ